MDKQGLKDRMHSGKLYLWTDEDLMQEQLLCIDKVNDYNATRPTEQKKRAEMLKDMFAEIGENCYIEPPLRANWGGKHVHLGNGFYANFNLTLVDDAHIYVGDAVMIAPNVTIATASHPVHPALRAKQVQYNLEIHIGNNVWIGAGAVLLPGVTIGDNSIIGAGSIVNKDIPANVVAVGNPCRVLREIGGRDLEYYHKDRKIEDDIWETIRSL